MSERKGPEEKKSKVKVKKTKLTEWKTSKET
jgi:hypothetical protein